MGMNTPQNFSGVESGGGGGSAPGEDAEGSEGSAGGGARRERDRDRQPPARAAKVVAVEKEQEKLLAATGDVCGGRGGELGRRLEAWLHVSGDADGRVGLGRRWAVQPGLHSRGGRARPPRRRGDPDRPVPCGWQRWRRARWCWRRWSSACSGAR